MAVELILTDKVSDLGDIGDIVKVSDGYARNYLIPKKLASKATPGVLRQVEVKKRRLQDDYERDVTECRERAEEISKLSITIPMQTGDDDKLYGSVTAQQILDALKEMNIEVDRKQVVLPEPIRELGVYSVDIYLHREVTTSLKVWIVKA